MSKRGNEYQIKVTANALTNIKEIIDFYIAMLPSAAEAFREAVDVKLRSIRENPYSYPIPGNLPSFYHLGYRKAPVYKHHVILYLINEKNKTIYIIYVVDTRRNLWLVIPEEPPQ